MSTYTHSLAPNGQWHVTGPEVDAPMGDGEHHAEFVASLLNLAYAVGRHAMVRETTEAKEASRG